MYTNELFIALNKRTTLHHPFTQLDKIINSPSFCFIDGADAAGMDRTDRNANEIKLTIAPVTFVQIYVHHPAESGD